MSIALVQSVKKVVTGVNNTTLAFPANVGVADLIVATQIHRANVATTITTPVDTLGHEYVPGVAEQFTDNTLRRLRTFYVQNTSAGADTVTFDISGTDTAGVEMVAILSEWSGAALSSPITGTPSLQGHTAGTSPTTGDTTPAVDGSLLYAALLSTGTSGMTITEEAGWTLIQEEEGTSNISGGAVYKLQTTAAADGHTWTLSASSQTVCHVIAFKQAAQPQDTIALVQSVEKIVVGVNNTTLAFGSVLGTGNLLIATQAHRADAVTNITTPADTRGHTFIPSVDQQSSDTGKRVHRTFHVPNSVAGADTVSYDISGTATAGVEWYLVQSEWSGADRTSPISGTPSLQPHTQTTTPTTGNTTPADNGCLLYAALLCSARAGDTLTSEAGWTELQTKFGDDNNVSGGVAYKFQTTAAPDGHTWTISVTIQSLCHVIAFKPALLTTTTGQAAITEAAETVSAAGAVAVAAAAAIQESTDTLSAAATVAVAAAASIQEAADSMVSAGVSGGLAGAGDITEAADALSAAGQAAISGAAAIQEAVEAVSGTGLVEEEGVTTVTEGADSMAAAGQAAVAGAAAIQEAVESMAATGLVPGTPVGLEGQAAIQEASDLISAVGAVSVIAQSGITEVSDILTATMRLLVEGEAAIVEAPDVLGAQAAEAPDTAAGAGGVAVTGVAAPITEAPDTVTGIGALPGGVIAEAPDVVTGTGQVAITGAGAIQEVRDDLAAGALGITKVSAARFTFTLNTSTGNQVVPYPADQNAKVFVGRFFLFTSIGGSGNSAGISNCFGCATPASQWVTYSSVLDNVSVTDAGDGGDDTKCIEFITSGGTTTEAAAFVSAGEGSFTINVTTAGAGRTMECLVLGGTDIEAQVGHYPNSPAGDRTVDTEVVNGKALLLAGGTDTEGSGRIISATGHLSIGAASSPNNQWSITARSRENLTTGSQTVSVNDDVRCFASLKFSLSEYRVSESLVSLGGSSFTVRPNPAGGTGEVYYAFLGGAASYAVRTLIHPTTPQSQSLIGFGFTPVASLFAGAGKPNTATIGQNWRHSLGMALSNANQVLVATTDTNAANPSEAASARVLGRCMTLRVGDVPTSVVDASFTSNDVDGITVNWLTTGADPPRMFGVLSVGLAPQVLVEQPNSLMLMGVGV